MVFIKEKDRQKERRERERDLLYLNYVIVLLDTPHIGKSKLQALVMKNNPLWPLATGDFFSSLVLAILIFQCMGFNQHHISSYLE